MEDSMEFLDNHSQTNPTHNQPQTQIDPYLFTNSHKISHSQPFTNNHLNANTPTYLFAKNNANPDSTINNSKNIPLTSIISPKNNRRLMHSYNTTSQESLAYSNSTYRNKLTERSPPLFNLDYFHINDQNVNTINSPKPSFNKGEMTFGINKGNNKGKIIKFDRITEQSKIQSEGNSFIYNNFSNAQTPFNINTISDGEDLLNVWDKNQQIGREQMVLQLPCFLSHQNSPQNIKFTHHNPHQLQYPYDSRLNTKQKESISKQTSNSMLNEDSLTIPMKNLSIKPISSKNKVLNQSTSQKEIATRRDSQNRQKRKSQLQVGMQNNKLSSQKSKKLSLKKQQPLQTNDITKRLLNNKQSQLKGRIKQLEYQLRTTQIEREQLRAKLSVMNQLLQERFLQNHCIRCYTVLDQSQRQVKKSQIKNKIQVLVEDRMALLGNQKDQRSGNRRAFKADCESIQRNQVSVKANLQKPSQIYNKVTDNDNHHLSNNQYHQFSNNKVRQPTDLQVEVQTLKQQLSQSLLRNKQTQQMICIITQKEKQTQQIISLLEEKEKRFQQIQRPKLLQQIKELTLTLNQQRETIDKLQMQTNLRNYLQSTHRKSPFISPQKDRIQQQQLSQQHITFSLKQIQTAKQRQRQQNIQQNKGKNTDQAKLLITKQSELERLKEQRDYFQKQYQGTKKLQLINYKLKLKIQDLENQLNSILQLMEVDDDITF